MSDAGEWIRSRACKRRLEHLREVAADAPEQSSAFGPRGFVMPEDEYEQTMLARALAHVDPNVTTACKLNDLAKPFLENDGTTVSWMVSIDHFGEPNIAATSHGHLRVRFDPMAKSYSAHLLWRDCERPFHDDFASTWVTCVGSQARMLHLLRDAHAWGARRWLEEREVLDERRQGNVRRRRESLADTLAHLP